MFVCLRMVDNNGFPAIRRRPPACLVVPHSGHHTDEELIECPGDQGPRDGTRFISFVEIDGGGERGFWGHRVGEKGECWPPASCLGTLPPLWCRLNPHRGSGESFLGFKDPAAGISPHFAISPKRSRGVTHPPQLSLHLHN